MCYGMISKCVNSLVIFEAETGFSVLLEMSDSFEQNIKDFVVPQNTLEIMVLSREPLKPPQTEPFLDQTKMSAYHPVCK